MHLDQSKIEILFQKEWKFIGMVYYGRSGSFFLQSILDGHPQIVALPPQINNIYNRTVYDRKRDVFRKTFTCSSLLKIFDPVIKHCLWNVGEESAAKSGPSRFYGENRDIFFSYDYSLFTTIFQELMMIAAGGKLVVQRKMIFLGLFFAYALMTGKSVDDLLYTEYLMHQIHTPIKNEVRALKEDFPHFIYLVSGREPISGLISHIQAYNDMRDVQYFTQGAYNWCVLAALDEVLNGAVVYDFLDKDHCRVVKNEYLHIYQEDYVRSLLDYLGLPWSDMCGKSTVDGEIFWWRFGDQYKTGFNRNYKWKLCDKPYASCKDKRFFSALLKDRYEAWNYAGCPNASFDIDVFLKEGFDFFETLRLSPYIRQAFTEKIVTYYQNSYGREKNYIPPLECGDYEKKQTLVCNFLSKRSSL